MKNFSKIIIGVSTLLLLVPFSASAATASITALSPGTSVLAKNKISFTVVTAGFVPQTYQLSDSFSGTTVTANNINPAGYFEWVPLAGDVGTHTLTITPRDYSDNSASVTQTITVLPPPSVVIQNLAPNASSMPGTQVTFSVVQTGFTNPTFIISDDFGGTSVNSGSLNSSGNFSWTPDLSQNGNHRITVYASDSLGHGANAFVDLKIGGGPKLISQLMSTSTTVQQGQFVSVSVYGSLFTPTSFSVSDSFPGSSVSNTNINTSGAFWWQPTLQDAGVHTITFLGQVGPFGDRASTTQTITVLGAGGALPPPAPVANTGTASSSMLSTLQAQLAALQAKMTGQSAASPTVVTGSPAFVFISYLKPGSEGEEVMQLQKILIQKSYLSAEATGYYGNKTVDAVVKLQAANGLSQLGVVGPATRALLNTMLGGTAAAPAATVTTAVSVSGSFKFEHFMGYGDDTDPDVTELQKRLKAMGYLSESAPLGFYGSATEAAVKKFQTAKGLSPVGYCDKVTRAALNQ